jgi:hypothetical protein
VVVDAEKKENERERRRKTLLSEKRSVLRKSLTGPTLLEMSGLRRLSRLASEYPQFARGLFPRRYSSMPRKRMKTFMRKA